MLKSISDFFINHIAPTGQTSQVSERSVSLASTALLIEMMQSDREVLDVEQQVVVDAITSQFDLSADEAGKLVKLAGEELKDATDYYQFTSLINSAFTSAQKLQVLEALWMVAYADQKISAHERHLMRKLADLLHMPHGDHMLAKNRARDRSRA